MASEDEEEGVGVAGICWLDPILITPELDVLQARVARKGWRVERTAPLTAPGDLPTTYDVKVAVRRMLKGIGSVHGSVVNARDKETGNPLLIISLSADQRLPAGWEAELDQFLGEHDPRPTTPQVLKASQPRTGVPRWLTGTSGDAGDETGPNARVAVPPSRSEGGPSDQSIAPRPSAPVNGKGHVFISYSRSDEAYVNRLVAYLRDAGVECWIDKSRIEGGDRWVQVIRANVDASAAFVVVMTPSSENRPWVMREISEAEKREKPILPLLLEGEEFFRLSDYEYESVVGGRMPSDRWVQRLRDLSTGNPATT